MIKKQILVWMTKILKLKNHYRPARCHAYFISKNDFKNLKMVITYCYQWTSRLISDKGRQFLFGPMKIAKISPLYHITISYHIINIISIGPKSDHCHACQSLTHSLTLLRLDPEHGDNRTTKQSTDPGAGLTWFVNNLTLVRLLQSSNV